MVKRVTIIIAEMEVNVEVIPVHWSRAVGEGDAATLGRVRGHRPMVWSSLSRAAGVVQCYRANSVLFDKFSR